MFQIESSGMQDLNRRLKPSSFEDLIAVLALYRPGPMESGMLDDFIERKHGRQAITYTFPAMETILKPTYGVIVYQEQVMQIVQTIGGFSLGYSDIIRRAMGKKKDLSAYNDEFSQGAAKQNLDYKKASELFDLIEKFAGYGFNKSHSAAYAMVTFQTAWLKTYYPQEFMAALLTSEKDNTDKVVKYIDEAKRMKIFLGAPNINHSQLEFSAINKDGQDQILFGLGAIKGVGEAAVESILDARIKGEFKDIQDFINRIEPQKVNKRVIECIIKAGGFDPFGYSRRALIEQVEMMVETAKKSSSLQKDAQFSLFGDDEEVMSVELNLKNFEEYDLKTLLDFEKDTLGFYVSGHPLDNFREQIDAISYTLSSEVENIADGSSAIFIGKVEEITKKMSKKGSAFGLVNLMDFHGNIEMMLFSDKLEQLEAMDLDEPIAFKVKVTHTEMFTRIGVTKIMTLAEAKKEAKKVETKIVEAPQEPLQIRLRLSDNLENLEKLYTLVRRHPGRREIKLTIVSKLCDVVIDSAIRIDNKLIEELNELEGVDVV
jgi:DNA polymerase-3 subunit alpha